MACRAALRVASTEREASLLRGLLSGALWTCARAQAVGGLDLPVLFCGP